MPWLDRLSLSFFFTGTLFCLVLLGLVLALDGFLPQIPRPIAKAIRTIADSTFTLYLVHVPFFILAFSIAGSPAHSWRGASIALTAVVVFSVVLAVPLDHLKLWIRNRLRRDFEVAANYAPLSTSPPG